MTTTRIFTNSLIGKPHNKTQYNKEFKNFIKAMSILKEAKKQVRFAHVEKILMKSTLNNEDVKKLADETTNRLAKRYQKKTEAISNASCCR